MFYQENTKFEIHTTMKFNFAHSQAVKLEMSVNKN